MSLAELLATPFFSGVGTSQDVPAMLPCSLGGHAYLLDTPRIEWETIDTLRPAIDTRDEPGQHSLNTAGVWSVIGADFRGGAGQFYFDGRDSSTQRFRASKGVNPWERERLSLLQATHEALAMAEAVIIPVSIDNELWVGGGTTLKRSTTALAGSPSWATVTVPGGVTEDLTAAATDGHRIYCAFGTDGIYRAAKGAGSVSLFSDYEATLLAYANGRLFAASAGELVEIDGAGTATAPLWSGGIGGDGTVVSVVGTPGGVFVGHNTDDRGEVLFIGLNQTTGALAVPLFAGSLNKGETLIDLEYYQDFIVATTSRGVRVSVLGNGGKTVSFGPAIEIPDVGAVAMWGEYGWFVWNTYDEDSNGLGRFDLSEFTEPFVPAYASDLMTDTALGALGALVVHQGQPFFAIANEGVYTQDPDNVVAEGSIDTGYLRFSTFERKVVVGVDLRHEPLVGGVTVCLADEEDVEVEVGVSTTAGTLGPASLINGNGLDGEAIELRLKLNANGGETAGPVLKRWTLRAMNVPRRTDVITLPIVMRSVIAGGNDGGQIIAQDTLAEWKFLKNLEASRTIATLRLGGATEQVIVDKVALAPERWEAGFNWPEGIILARCLTISAGA